MAKFLPPEAIGETYAIQHDSQNTFAAQPTGTMGLMQDIATKMGVEHVNDMGRIPSLMSRAYNFYIDLFPEQFADRGAGRRVGRLEAQQRARRAFRGILTLLALRDMLGLKVEMRTFHPRGTHAPANGVPDYRPFFAAAYGDSPKFGKGAWQDFRYLVILPAPGGTGTQRGQSRADTLCGLSPYTALFPAARPLKQCNNIFWHNNSSGEWLDPTTDWTNHRDSASPEAIVDYEVIKSVRGCMKSWLEIVCQGGPETVWLLFGMEINPAHRLGVELGEWLSELRRLESLPPPAGFRVEAAPVGLGITNAQGTPTPVPMLEQKATWGAPGRNSLPGLVSEMPRVHGRVILSSDVLRNPNKRICGQLMGKESLTIALENLPPEGEGFSIHDGERTYFIGEPYVIPEKLFLDAIHYLGNIAISKNFFALNPSNSGDDWWMFPFHERMLQYLDLDQLRQRGGGSAVKCSYSDGATIIAVTVNIGGYSFTRNYDKGSKIAANWDMGTGLDVRIWPNFRFPGRPKLPVRDEDRVHYFRVRQQAMWGLQTKILARQVGNPAGAPVVEGFATNSWDVGWPDELDRNALRLARCHAFPAMDAHRPSVQEWEPIGVEFEGRGFFLIRLEEPTNLSHGAAAPWKIGVDFGTSNTCVAFAVDGASQGSPPQEIRFEVQTISLHLHPVYEIVAKQREKDLATEGAAAVLDFPYKYEDESYYPEAAFFPTQIVTKLVEGDRPIGNQYLMSNGLIFARNMLDSNDIVSLLQKYPPVPDIDDRPFRLIPDPKWEHIPYRKPFLWHLYKMIVYHAAKHGAEIRSVAFSFPRAFTKAMEHNYETELSTIFDQHGGIPHFDIMTESDAVQRWMLHDQPSAHPLVLDIGGGSTDLLGLFQERRIQASYELAAGCVNKYFTESPRFQRIFKEAIEHVVPLRAGDHLQRARRFLLRELYSGLNSGRKVEASYSEQAFFRMLNMMEGHYSQIVDFLYDLPEGPAHQSDRMAVAGFFHTLALLYTGIIFQAGRLLKPDQHNITVRNLNIKFIGNGSRFYHFLDRGVPFSKVLAGIFCKASGQRPQLEVDLEPAGKTYVAKGMLTPTSSTEIRAAVAEDKESHRFLLRLAEEANPPVPQKAEFPELAAFLEGLSSELPGGKLDGLTVIPYCQRNLATELGGTEAGGLFDRIITYVHRMELEKAGDLKRDWDEAEDLARTSLTAAAPARDSALAAEPVFIIQLKCLLDVIRERYADSD